MSLMLFLYNAHILNEIYFPTKFDVVVFKALSN